MTENIALTLREVSKKYSDDTGLIEAATGRSLTFQEIEKISDSYAHYFQNQGVNAGDRVMLMVKPSVDFICLTFSLFKIGATIILIDPGMGYKNLLTCIEGVKPSVFVGITAACIFKSIFPKVFKTVVKTFCCGNSLFVFGPDIRKVGREFNCDEFSIYSPNKDDLASIIFTTGSTGPPKGVRYEHSIFSAQLKQIRDYYKIAPGDIDQPAFPLFALFSTALGACAVIPDMNPTKPAQVDPIKFINSIKKYGVTYSFGSPAIWSVVSKYCLNNDVQLNTLKKVLMAGAPVPGELIQRVFSSISADGQIFTPYGATESLPIVSIEGREVTERTWDLTRQGKGTCVGRPLPGISIKVIEIDNDPIDNFQSVTILPENEIGEIIVRGEVVTKGYENNLEETKFSKIQDGDTFWHRMGDTGYLDDEGRLWFCGRKAHRVITKNETKFTIQCEAISNNHPGVFRSALVGIPIDKFSKFEKPVMIIEKNKEFKLSEEKLLLEVQTLCAQSPLTKDIEHFLSHPSFPVDIRHNAKIFREKLAVWARSELGVNYE